jgi:predicted enzyme related to lactoylglutathione lyase
VIKTHGLTHLALAVRDVERAFAFYHEVFGAVKIYHEPGFLQAQTPGSRDVLVFEENPAKAGQPGGVAHFGFRLCDPADCEKALQAITEAGGTILRHGEFCPGEPYVFATDPDGYEIEIWFERPTPIDPPL